MSKERQVLSEKLVTIYGEMSVPDWTDDLIVRTLRAHGEWAFSEQLLLGSLLRHSDRLWDVGAFLGTCGLGVAQNGAATPASLVAVEPGPALQPHLQANLERNAPCPFRIAPFAAAAGSTSLRPRNDSGAGNAGAITYEMAEGDELAVIGRSLQDLRAEYDDYDVLKLDIEGMENDAIRGDIDYILQHRPVVWAECNETPSSILLLEALCWIGYEPLYVAFPAFRSDNFNKSPYIIFPMAYEAALLAAPLDRMQAFVGRVQGEDIITRPVKTSFDLRKALWATPRWSLPDWTSLSRPELIALMGRQMRKQELVDFLADQV